MTALNITLESIELVEKDVLNWCFFVNSKSAEDLETVCNVDMTVRLNDESAETDFSVISVSVYHESEDAKAIYDVDYFSRKGGVAAIIHEMERVVCEQLQNYDMPENDGAQFTIEL